ncbi:hypothetical protein HK096_004674, partial [Nowakowskiella sp. JEL0078]
SSKGSQPDTSTSFSSQETTPLSPSANTPALKLTRHDQLKQLVHAIEPHLRKIFQLAWESKTGTAWNPPRKAPALAYLLETYPMAKETTHMKFLKHRPDHWDISTFGYLTYDTDLFDDEEIKAIRAFRDARNLYSHAPDGIVTDKEFKKHFTKIDGYVKSSFFQGKVGSQKKASLEKSTDKKQINESVALPTQIEISLASNSNLRNNMQDQLYEEYEEDDEDIPYQSRLAKYSVRNDDSNIIVDYGFDADVGVYLYVSDKRLEYDEHASDGVNYVLSKFARPGGEYFDVHTGSIGTGRRVTYQGMSQLLNLFNIKHETIKHLIGQAILTDYIMSATLLDTDYKHVYPLDSEYAMEVIEKLGAPYVNQIKNSAVNYISPDTSPISISYGFDEITGVFFSASDKRLAYSKENSDELNLLVFSDLNRKSDDGDYFSIHTAIVGFGERITSGEFTVLLRRFGAPEKHLANLVLKQPLGGNMLFRSPPKTTDFKNTTSNPGVEGKTPKQSKNTSEASSSNSANRNSSIFCNSCVDGSKKCSACRSIRYCSIECQKTDWNIHKLICKELPFPPKDKSKSTINAFVFHTDSQKPQLKQFTVSNKRIDFDMVFGKDPLIGHSYVEGIDVFNKSRKVLKVLYRDLFLNDGSPPNKCILHLTNKRAGHPWMGPVIAIRGDLDGNYCDVESQDLTKLQKFFMQYGL